jgi:hypothetical protein
MAEPSLFRHYQIVQDAAGNNVELARTQEQVAVLAFDTERIEFVHCHVLLEPLENRKSFEASCKTLQREGHPLFARVIDFGEDDGNPFYITGNVDGETLSAYFQRQTELPVWLAVLIAGRALDSAIVVAERGDFLCENALETFRLFQTSASSIHVLACDFRIVERAGKNKGRLVKSNFERQGKFLRAFLQEKAGAGSGPSLPDNAVSAVDFAELLGAVLGSGGPGLIEAMTELRTALRKLIPDHLATEVQTAHKPRALVAPLLASYQDVARAVVNLVRIQSQRLDMANPYAMRGTLTRAGRPVMVEQIPPSTIAGRAVLDFDNAAQKLGRKRDITALLGVPLVNDNKASIACMAEDVVDGFTVADLLAVRGSFQVNETYLILAGVDAALSQLEASRLPTRKLRLEDVLLLTSFGKDDPRTMKLLSAKLTEWPSFSIMLRAHPTLASMTGRGTDPSVLLPPALPGAASIWHAGWLSCLARFLLEQPATASTAPQREREAILTLVNEELAKARDGSATSRGDFLARFARIIQHYDLVQPVPITVIPPSQTTKKPAAQAGRTLTTLGQEPPKAPAAEPVFLPPAVPKAPEQPAPTPQPLAQEPLKPATLPLVRSTEDAAGMEISPVARQLGGSLAGALTQGGVSMDALAKPTIGFAELLFQGGSDGPPPAPVHHQVVWGTGASAQIEAGEVGGWEEAPEDIPGWLKAAVFFGGTIVVGAILAHLTGDALWQKQLHAHIPPAPAPIVTPKAPAKAGTIIQPGRPTR